MKFFAQETNPDEKINVQTYTSVKISLYVFEIKTLFILIYEIFPNWFSIH